MCISNSKTSSLVVQPTSIFINTFESEKKPIEDIQAIVDESFDLTPAGIINNLNLLEPIYQKTASYGHFGREDQNFTWEEVKKL